MEMDILREPVYLSSLSALLGGCLVKIFDFLLKSRSQSFKESQTQRMELWTEIRTLKAEVAECREKHDECQRQYYELLADLKVLKEAFIRHQAEQATPAQLP